MGTLVFQANLGGAVNLNGPNIASTVNFTLPSADGTNGQALVTNGTGTLSFSTVTSPPGGSTTQVQYNNAGAFAGSANFTFNGTTVTMANDAYANSVRIGKGAGSISTNTVMGVTALASNTTGSYNTAGGYNALNANTTSALNTAFGALSLQLNTGSNNTAIGADSLPANTTGSYNTAVGNRSLWSNTTASNNTAVGYQALYTNSTGLYSVAVGYQAAYTNNGGGIVAIGNGALYSNTTGTSNVAIGSTYNTNSPLYYNTTGEKNVAVGEGSLKSNTTASQNTAIGYSALWNNTTANGNTAVGYQAGYSNQTAFVTAIGYQSLFSFNKAAAVDTHNTAVGYQVLYNCTTGIVNVGVGCYSYGGNTSTLNAVTTGSYNTAIGGGSGRGLTTGLGMTFLGYEAGYNISTGNYGFYAGYGPTASSSSVSYEYVIGFNVAGKGASTGFISPNGGGVYQGNNSSTWSTTSDRRLKKNIVDNNVGLEKLSQIQVRNFEYRLPEEVDPELKPADAINKPGIQLGVIAQELQQILPDCVKQESTGVLSVDSDNLTWYLINAVKQLKAEVEALKGN